MQKRKLGRSGIEVSPLGMGCWAIGGPFWRADGGASWQDGDDLLPGGWGQVDDGESIHAMQTAIDLGINVFDTSNSYGCGHSETIIGKAITGQREKVVITGKFGNVIDEDRKIYFEHDASPAHIRQSLEDSLRRLNTDYIDVFQFHWSDFDGDLDEVIDTLETCVTEGKIRWYGWSTDDTEKMTQMAQGEHCAVVQHAFSLLRDKPEMLAICDEYDLASLNRGPLAMGVLTGKFTPESTFPKDDIRHGWNFAEGSMAGLYQAVENLRDVLTSDGRSMVQGALGWLWARSERTIPIPGFKNVKQVEENAKALQFGALNEAQMRQIDTILGR